MGEHVSMIQAINTVLNVLLVPGVVALWRLSNSIRDLKFAIYTQFVTREEFEKRIEYYVRKPKV